MTETSAPKQCNTNEHYRPTNVLPTTYESTAQWWKIRADLTYDPLDAAPVTQPDTLRKRQKSRTYSTNNKVRTLPFDPLAHVGSAFPFQSTLQCIDSRTWRTQQKSPDR